MVVLSGSINMIKNNGLQNTPCNGEGFGEVGQGVKWVTPTTLRKLIYFCGVILFVLTHLTHSSNKNRWGQLRAGEWVKSSTLSTYCDF